MSTYVEARQSAREVWDAMTEHAIGAPGDHEIRIDLRDANGDLTEDREEAVTAEFFCFKHEDGAFISMMDRPVQP